MTSAWSSVATTSMGSAAIRATGAKAFEPSKGSFEYSAERAANAGVASSSVWPSGGALATMSATAPSLVAIRLSIVTGWPNALPSPGARARATASGVLPGGDCDHQPHRRRRPTLAPRRTQGAREEQQQARKLHRVHHASQHPCS